MHIPYCTMFMFRILKLLSHKTVISNYKVKRAHKVFKLSDRLKLSFEERLPYVSNAVAKKLVNIIISKKTNLCLAADLKSATDILNLAENVGPYICALKTHCDIIEDFNENFIKHLKDIAKRHEFLLFEDRKFSDIGETVRLQYMGGLHKISSWSDIVTAHSLTGKGVLDALNAAHSETGVFLLAETSAAGNLITETYTKETIKMAELYPDLMVGIVCQNPLFTDKPGLLQLIPGVQIDSTQDSLGQRYNSPEAVILERGGDIAVVGRGVTKSADPEATAIEYKTLLWKAYAERIKK